MFQSYLKAIYSWGLGPCILEVWDYILEVWGYTFLKIQTKYSWGLRLNSWGLGTYLKKLWDLGARLGWLSELMMNR